MPRSWREDFFERLVEASLADGDTRLATAKAHARKKTASYQHPQLRSLECSFDTDRIGDSQTKQVLVIEASLKRGTEIDAPTLKKEFRDAGMTGEAQISDGSVLFQYQWGVGSDAAFPVHNPQRVSEAVTWVASIVKLLSEHIERRQQVLKSSGSDNSEASSGTDYAAALEQYLEDLIVEGWASLQWTEHLEYVDRQIDCGEIGELDILAKDKATGDFVVIELKKDRPERQVVGQLSSYMGWIAENRADAAGVGVRGIIVAHEVSERLRAAVLPHTNIDLYTYRFAVALRPVELSRPTVETD